MSGRVRAASGVVVVAVLVGGIVLLVQGRPRSVVVESKSAASSPSGDRASSLTSPSVASSESMSATIVVPPRPESEAEGGWILGVEPEDVGGALPARVDVMFASDELPCIDREAPVSPWQLLVGMTVRFTTDGPAEGGDSPIVRAMRLVVNCDVTNVFADSGWELATAGPVDGRIFPSVVWTSTELIVWGGEKPSETEWHSDGAAYNPVTDSWRTLAPSPLAARSEHVAVWTGTETLVCCGRIVGSGAGAAAYDPQTDRWRSLPPAPTGAAFPVAVWTGEEMIVTGGVTGGGVGQAHATFAYNPQTDEWRRLADVPVDLERTADAVWTGQEMVVWSSVLWPRVERKGWAYDPDTDEWRGLPVPPREANPVAASLVWTGTEVIAVGVAGEGDALIGGAYDPEERTWRALDIDLPPARGQEGSSGSQAAVWTGNEMLVWTGYLGSGVSESEGVVLAYSPSDDAWRQLARSPVVEWRPPIAWANDRLLVYGSRGVQALHRRR